MANRLFTTLTVGEKEYKLRLDAQNAVLVEKRLGKSVLDVMLGMAPDNLDVENGVPQNVSVKGMSMIEVESIVTILQGSLQKYQHGMDITSTYGLYDDYIDAGGSYQDFFQIVQEILQVSGFLSLEPEKPQEETAAETVPAEGIHEV